MICLFIKWKVRKYRHELLKYNFTRCHFYNKGFLFSKIERLQKFLQLFHINISVKLCNSLFTLYVFFLQPSGLPQLGIVRFRFRPEDRLFSLTSVTYLDDRQEDTVKQTAATSFSIISNSHYMITVSPRASERWDGTRASHKCGPKLHSKNHMNMWIYLINTVTCTP
jgi:hypothetical protein